MKKLFFIMLVINTLIGQAQDYETLHIEDLYDFSEYWYCANHNIEGVIVYGEMGCEDKIWFLNNTPIATNDSIIIENPGENAYFEVYYEGCDITNIVVFINFTLPPNNPFEETIIWKRKNEFITLNAKNEGLWSTGEYVESIEVSEPGNYSVTLTSECGSQATYSVEVRDNVELYRATVDLRTNKNKVTWLATPEQAEYITEVKVYRDGNLVGTVPYANGYFLDAIGSDAAARTYQIVGVSVEGDDCPIASYQKGTIHTTYYLDVNNDLNMTWNAPYIQEEAEGQLTGYQIYKYNPATEELTLIDEVNTTITNYTCSANAFFGGRATVAAVFSSKGDGQTRDEIEERAFSNLTENTFTVVEQNGVIDFNVYPNPTNGEFTVQGVKDLTVFNTLGQTIATSHSENGTHQITVSSGIYFIKSDEGVVRKVVVEGPI